MPLSPTRTRYVPTANWSGEKRSPQVFDKRRRVRTCLLRESCCILGLNKSYEHLAHHDFVFSRDPREEFHHIYDLGEPAPDPTCYLASTDTSPIRPAAPRRRRRPLCSRAYAVSCGRGMTGKKCFPLYQAGDPQQTQAAPRGWRTSKNGLSYERALDAARYPSIAIKVS